MQKEKQKLAQWKTQSSAHGWFFSKGTAGGPRPRSLAAPASICLPEITLPVLCHSLTTGTTGAATTSSGHGFTEAQGNLVTCCP